MFHLSIPVRDLDRSLRFYAECFGGRAVGLGRSAANMFVFGAQLTLHEKPSSHFLSADRQDMHFGAVVPRDEWYAIRDRLAESEIPLLRCREPGPREAERGKLVVADPDGNLVEINSAAPEDASQ